MGLIQSLRRIIGLDSGPVNPFTGGSTSDATRVVPSNAIDYDLMEFLARRYGKAYNASYGVSRDIFENWFTISDLEGETNDELNKQAEAFTQETDLKNIVVTAFYYERWGGFAIVVDWTKVPGIRPPFQFEAFHRNVIDIVFNADTGEPETYKIEKQFGEVWRTMEIPPKAVYHLVTRPLFDIYHGFPALGPIYMDLVYSWHIGRVSATAYSRWSQGFPVFEKEDGSFDPKNLTLLNSMIDKFDVISGLALDNGIKLTFAQNNPPDPNKFMDLQTKEISSGSFIPKSMLEGSEQGAKLSSETDQEDYSKLLRGEQQLADKFLREIYIGSGSLPDDDQWKFTWNDPHVNRKEQLEIEQLEKNLEGEPTIMVKLENDEDEKIGEDLPAESSNLEPSSEVEV